jgi:hypothetical protein
MDQAAFRRCGYGLQPQLGHEAGEAVGHENNGEELILDSFIDWLIKFCALPRPCWPN